MEPYAATAVQYREFVAHAADSPPFAAWAAGVAEDPDVVAWLASLPLHKQQPNLVFAAARWHGVPATAPYAALRDALLGDDGTIRATVLARSTQTNEAGRLATLVPAFVEAAGPGPVALLEVGASAGLCLYPDRYAYRWSTADGERRAGSGPELRADVAGPAPLPAGPPVVAWRGGVDLNPLDVTDDAQMQWLTTLIWPGQDDRRAQLARAIEVARADPPTIRRGDLLEELPGLVEEAAEHGPVVVFHSAVIAYLAPEDRARFHAMMTGLVAAGRCHWVSNEGPRVLPEVAATFADLSEDHHGFVLGIDGRAVAQTHGHGRWLHWRA
ncbi:DUF2332 domain-containing protein [Nocardioides mangrovi]|uniref:DUF2332 domain-containing protein n=1 Tax=Nocardioides mangrovi TaxID=2874580 RepID=A0ABS7UB26_9ACTN|nr:DUF2332 domain-containing protein [Nocardioides mangrovi]MBZ5738082.1 DUF2332 domain-containing protein [Nocardioides mangrovi]